MLTTFRFYLACAIAACVAAFASCGGAPKGRPTLPPPEYEPPTALPDASASPPPVPAAPAQPVPAAPGPPASAPR